jgi:hypothetical protein
MGESGNKVSRPVLSLAGACIAVVPQPNNVIEAMALTTSHRKQRSDRVPMFIKFPYAKLALNQRLAALIKK